MKVINSTDNMAVASFIAERIIGQLARGKKVLWLVPGGSGIPITVAAARMISVHPHASLTVTLTDERYGPVGHADSNWFQMEQKGFVLPQARLISVLVEGDRSAVTLGWGKMLEAALEEADYVIGFFGIGADGHIAGMLPFTGAVNSDEYAFSYQASQYERITMTPRVIDELDEVVAFAVGEAKHPTLRQLQQEEVPIEDQPAQLLKRVPQFTLFTDCTL